MSGQPVTVDLARADGELVAWPAHTTLTPGLVVHESMGDPGWCVTHERSGLLLAMVDYEDQAQALAAALAVCGDWTMSGVAIRQDTEMIVAARRIRAACRGYRFAVNDHPFRDVRAAL